MRRDGVAWLVAAIATLAVVTLSACGPEGPEAFTVPERCYAAGTAIAITGIADGDARTLYYGPQGGQHVYPRVVVRGVDPRALTVRVSLVRELDGVSVGDQAFTRFVPGEDECDVAIPETELFVQSRLVDGHTARVRVTAFERMRTAMHEATGVCVASEGECGPHPPLVLRVAGTELVDGATVTAADGAIAIEVEGTGVVYGRAGEATIEQRASVPIAIEAMPGDAIELALALSPEIPPMRGVLGVFRGTIHVAP